MPWYCTLMVRYPGIQISDCSLSHPLKVGAKTVAQMCAFRPGMVAPGLHTLALGRPNGFRLLYFALFCDTVFSISQPTEMKMKKESTRVFP
jgi:hypothetical protein